ncbi:DUF6266 family protein [Flavobacterium orientale]|nr:DUF6266 family protein [Flavobacterium orientale]
MGTYNKGILGAFYGKVGTVVGATWRGKDVMRSLPRRSNRAATILQRMQRDRFTLVANFMLPLATIYAKYFGTKGTLKTPKNQAMSYLIKEAVLDDGTEAYWEFNKILVTRGDLLGLSTLSGVAGTNHDVDVTWQNNSGQGNALDSDLVLAVAYEKTSNLTWYAEGIATRDTEAVTLPLPAYWSGLEVHVWMAVVADDDSKYATSQYLGAITLT